MNVVPFLCRMALNLHQKRPSSVTSGWPFHRAIRREIVIPSSVLMAMVQGNYPLGGYTFERAGLMSAAKSTLSDDVHHRTLPPWGLYFFYSPRHFTIDARFCDRINHDDAMPRMVTCGAFDSTKKESTTPKGVAFLPPCSPG